MSKDKTKINYCLYTLLATVFYSFVGFFNSIYYYKKIKRDKEQKLLREIVKFSMSNHKMKFTPTGRKLVGVLSGKSSDNSQ
jgi:hypothetical protein